MSKAEPEALADVDPLLAGYADALRDHDTPTREQTSATWAAIEAQTTSRARVWVPIVVAVAAVIVGVLLVAPSSSLQEAQREPASAAPYRGGADRVEGRAAPKVPSPLRDTPTQTPRPPQPPAAPESEQPSPPPARPAPPPKRPKVEPEASEPSSLAQETLLLRKIQRARAAKQHARVLELTAEHAKRFPDGTFASERSLARVQALCSVGREADARRARDRFVDKHPRSHLVPQFKAACPD